MKSTFDANGFLQVSFDDHSSENTNNNSDKYTFTIAAIGGQSMIVDNKEVDKLEFTIVGNLEIQAFFEAMNCIESL